MSFGEAFTGGYAIHYPQETVYSYWAIYWPGQCATTRGQVAAASAGASGNVNALFTWGNICNHASQDKVTVWGGPWGSWWTLMSWGCTASRAKVGRCRLLICHSITSSSISRKYIAHSRVIMKMHFMLSVIQHCKLLRYLTRNSVKLLDFWNIKIVWNSLVNAKNENVNLVTGAFRVKKAYLISPYIFFKELLIDFWLK